MNIPSETQVAIVGAGAAGACVAYALAEAGVKVVLLEKGSWLTDTTHDDDELYYYILRKGWPSLEKEHTAVDLGLWDNTKPIHRMGQSYGCVGGGTVFYAGVSERFREVDFIKASRYGSIPDCSITDWPKDFYKELDPYYTKAEYLIGISGDASADPLDPPRSRDVLLPPLPRHLLNDLLAAGARKLGWNPFPIPLALNSQFNRVNGQNWCVSSGICSGYPCAWNAKNSVDRALLRRAAKRSNLVIIPGVAVKRIESDGNRCTGVVFSERGKSEEYKLKADVVVLAASGILSPHLMLLSKSNKHPDGLGNGSGLLGKNLMFHIEGQKGAYFNGSFASDNFYNVKKLQVNDHYLPSPDKDGFINHVSIQTGSQRGPIRYAQTKSPGGWGRKYLEEMTTDYMRFQELQAMVEDLPRESNSVSVDWGNVDDDGLPRAKVTHRFHPMDGMALMKTFNHMRQWLEASGCERISPDPQIMLDWLNGPRTSSPPWRPVGYHLMGSVRMGIDPKTSVVDRDCRSHEVPNLFVADSSIFPSSAGVNPTLTIQANAFRIADRIIALAAKGEL